uniref:Coatomer subunit beta n=1 Tax=Onchocerca volvulus TaxID=6282 RepID=A0A8R1TIP8_ONCVO
MSSGELPCYTLIHVPSDFELPSEVQLKEKFEKGDVKAKTDALKKLIMMIMNGEKIGQGMMMQVIRFCLPTSDHTIKKLLLLFFEIVPKTASDGKLLHEMILVCDAYRKDLQHPNEFIRGSTLRFLCKLREPELLEPLMPAIRSCLEHRHAYVRRNAVLAIFTIYRNFEFLIPDAPELISTVLNSEQDASCKRNAFMMLLHVDQSRALDYLSEVIDQVTTFGDILQLIIVELIYKVCHANPSERARFIRCVYNLLQSSSPAVRYEAAGTLITLSSAPTAIKAAASAYIDLVVKESDNNVKLIVLDRLIELRTSPASEKVLRELVMDVLRVLSASDLEVRKKTLQLALDLVSSRNVEEMVMYLKKEIGRSSDGTAEEAERYRQMLVRTLHSTTVKFPDVASNILPVLMEFLSEDSENAAQDVLAFVRETVQRLPHLRPVVLAQLLDVFGNVSSAQVFRSGLWILGEYCESAESVMRVMEFIRKSLGELPIVEKEMQKTDGNEVLHEKNENSTTEVIPKARQLVTADGTYATQSALSIVKTEIVENKTLLRQFLLDGNFFLASSLATTLIKLVFNYSKFMKNKNDKINSFAGEVLFMIASIINLGKSGLAKTNATEDDLDHLGMSIKILCGKWPEAEAVFLQKCRDSLELMLESKSENERFENETANRAVEVNVDRTISFTQLAPRVGDGVTGTENLFDLSLSQALGTVAKSPKFDFASSKLGKVKQLAGFSDPVYAEAYINVNQYDIVLDVLIVNQTNDTLQNVCLELSTVGDIKLLDKPTPLTLAPRDFSNIKATVKVASTENGVIFSTIAYDVRGSTSDRNCVYLEDIHIDIMDYIIPGSCTDTEFRHMWAEFEWENKVNVNTPITDLRAFLTHLSTITNMKLLTTDAALGNIRISEGECGFLAANFCAHSIFGEDALANVSMEKTNPLDPNSPIIGHIRIRAKSQGMALSLGDKINFAQKESKVTLLKGEAMPI